MAKNTYRTVSVLEKDFFKLGEIAAITRTDRKDIMAELISKKYEELKKKGE